VQARNELISFFNEYSYIKLNERPRISSERNIKMDDTEICFQCGVRYMEMTYDTIKWRVVLLVVLDYLQILGLLKYH
jgi:hypothetical protein